MVNNAVVKLTETINEIKKTFSNSDDLKIRELTVGGTRCAFSYIDGGIDRELFEQSIIAPLMKAETFSPPFKEALSTRQ